MRSSNDVDLGDTTDRTSTTTQLDLVISPQLRVVHVPDSLGLGFAIGPLIQMSRTTREVEGVDGSETDRSRAFGMHMSLGLTAFVARAFSIEPQLVFDFAKGTTEDDAGNELDQRIVRVGLVVAFAGWAVDRSGDPDEEEPAEPSGRWRGYEEPESARPSVEDGERVARQQSDPASAVAPQPPGEVTLGLDGAVLRIEGDSNDLSSVRLELLRFGNVVALRDCTTLEIGHDGDVDRLVGATVEVAPTQRAIRETLRVEAPMAAIETLGAASQVDLRACGTTVTVQVRRELDHLDHLGIGDRHADRGMIWWPGGGRQRG